VLYLESPTEIVSPKRYRNDWGQLLEHSPYSNRDLRAPEEMPARDEEGEFTVHLKVRGKMTAYHYRRHPFDVVGWDGYLFPYIFNIGDFEPITGRVHQPPPVHQTFSGRNYVVCSFVPRKFDYHPLAIPAPYNHSNINSDEVIYYVAGNFMSRRGVDISSFTVHPAGIPHGPHPGTVEASIGKEGTEELAVMVDTFHGLHLTPEAAALEDPAYPYSWLPSDDPGADAQALAERGPEAFPD
jgi:homogentisate 1,2-dioxygenase